MDQLEGYCTVSGAAKLLNRTYWDIYTWVRRNKIPTIKLTGSPTVLIKLSDLAELTTNK
jgi:excisionase family DNA binding protein